MSEKEKEPQKIYIQGSVEKRSARLSHPDNQPKSVPPNASMKEGEKK